MKKIAVLAMLLFFITTAFKTETPASADEVLKQALTKAKKENKHVFVIFKASWCGYCHKMIDVINTPEIKPLFDKYYVVKELTVMENPANAKLENPGALDLLKKYNSDGFGIPVWFVFDKNGKLQVDSHIRPEGTGLETKGSNIIGCPITEEEVAIFIKELKKTSKLSESELATIALKFKKLDPKFKG